MKRTFFNLTNDYLFKQICYDKEFLKLILDKLFNIKFNNVLYLNKELLVINKNHKPGIVDMLLKLDDDYVILELQVQKNKNFKNRLIIYSAANIFIHGLLKGEDYIELGNFKTLAITNFTSENNIKLNNIELIKNNKYLFSDKLNIKILDLTKYEDKEKNILYKLFKFKTKNELEQIEKEIDNQIYKRMIERIKYYNLDEKERMKMDRLAKLLRDEPNQKQIAFNKGKILGINEGKIIGINEGKIIGINEGKIIGINEGKAIGLREGMSKRSSEIAKNLLSQNVDISIIMNATKLSEQQILALK